MIWWHSSMMCHKHLIFTDLGTNSPDCFTLWMTSAGSFWSSYQALFVFTATHFVKRQCPLCKIHFCLLLDRADQKVPLTTICQEGLLCYVCLWADLGLKITPSVFPLPLRIPSSLMRTLQDSKAQAFSLHRRKNIFRSLELFKIN